MTPYTELLTWTISLSANVMLNLYCDLAKEEGGLSLLRGGWTGESVTPLWLGGDLQTV